MREWDSGDLGGGSSSNIAMEQENRELKAKIAILEGQIADKETELAYYKAEQSRSLLVFPYDKHYLASYFSTILIFLY